MSTLRVAALVGLALLSSQSWAQGSGRKVFSLAVAEGIFGVQDASLATAKYEGIAEAIGRSLGGEVKVIYARDRGALNKGMKDGSFDLVLSKPSDGAAQGVRDFRYQYVANGKPDGYCYVVIAKDSTLTKLADVKGHPLTMPERDTYMGRFCRAELRDRGIRLENETVSYVRDQDAIPFALENRMSDAGGLPSFSATYKKWQQDGHKVLHKSIPQPFMPIIASPHLSPEQVGKVRDALVALAGTEGGRVALERVGATAFVGNEEDRLKGLLEWLEK